MEALQSKVRRLCEEDPEMALVFGAYEEAEAAYVAALEAIGHVGPKHRFGAASSAGAVVSFQNSPSTARETIGEIRDVTRE